jgi:hypothetical protein
MRITESRLRSIIKSVIKESDMDSFRDDMSIAKKDYGRGMYRSPTNFEHAYEQGDIDQATFYSNSPDHRDYSGQHYSEDQISHASEIEEMKNSKFYQSYKSAWCSFHDLNDNDYNNIVKTHFR